MCCPLAKGSWLRGCPNARAHTPRPCSLAQCSPCVFFPEGSESYGSHCEAGFRGGNGAGGCQCAFLYADVEADFREGKGLFEGQRASFGCERRGRRETALPGEGGG